ncbi:LytR C-terminal domain-containing protein [Ornithinimicrobium avium]|uniref:LytR family transcriptional regulator n=1 Tax=Ornithinimicrobium avium TaxID=2283195 RepID=A0A345NML7_9MICO|nr:LytR C-terminal domain-containing protein [Ornithinimicrobium avium]AXH96275.1 LytR family transcriptional regulator [Ornithinimicrobium avium]
MGYVRTAGMSTAARRARRRAALVISGLLLALLVVFGLAMAFVQGWISTPGGSGDAAATSAVSAPPPAMTVAEVSVNVYNAGGIPGAAGRAGESLRERGYSVATVANDPEGADVPGVGVIRHGPKGIEEAELLRADLPGSVELVDDGRDSAVVDLVLGAQWEDLPAAGASDADPSDADPSEEG